MIDRAENYYNDIADALGFKRYDFWLWENRAKIYIYDNADAYRQATGQPDWSSGCAYARDKIIHTFPYAQGFFDSVLPHELGHIVFREFVGFDNSSIPIWLDEGVASYQEKARYFSSRMVLKQAISQGKFMNIAALNSFDLHACTDHAQVALFYNESVNLVSYLIKEFGQDSFVVFCQHLRDKRNFDEALRSAYPYANIDELSRAWEDSLR